MKEKLVVATGNAHKLREISQIFTQYEVVSQKQAGFDEDVEETGVTFEENALIKARAASKALGVIALADDSGICVEALGGAPGVYSARYCGYHGSDQENRDLLLKNLQGQYNTFHGDFLFLYRFVHIFRHYQDMKVLNHILLIDRNKKIIHTKLEHKQDLLEQFP